MLNLTFVTPKISAFLIQVSLRRPYAEGTFILLQCHNRKKTDVKFLNKYIYIYIYVYNIYIYKYIYIYIHIYIHIYI